LSRRPRPTSGAVAIELEIPFHDVDGLRVVWHGHYCKYLELGRTALLRARRLDAPDLAALGYLFLVAETHLRHVRPLRYADRVRVTSWLVEIDNRIRVTYELRNVSSEQVCAEGSTVLVTVSDSGELCLATPPAILERLLAPGCGSFTVE
jgi:acyl-CoA thioester hydrolase